MDGIKISRDKQNPTWVWVHNQMELPDKTCPKRILIDIIDAGCMCVSEGDTTKYINGENYNIYRWKYFTIIKEPTYRPFKDGNEFIEYCKARTDMRVIRKSDGCLHTITDIDSDPTSNSCMWVGCGEWLSPQVVFGDFTWLDGSPIGVKE